jgi:fimbrial isopeptide formation D2 family protein/uncharacterized repeat protein (TIGR01451 family)
MERLQNITSQTLIKLCLVAAFLVASSPVLAEVCYDNTSTLNSSSYALNTALQTTPGFPLSFYGGALRFSNTTFSGTARWVNGVQIQNDGSDYIYLQPDRATNYLATNNDATYTFTFPKRTTSFSAVFAGLNNYDGTTISASYLGSPVAITAANFSNLSAGMSLKDADGNGQMDTVVSTNTSGGTNATSNTYTLTISSPIDTLTVVSGKDTNSTSTVTIGLRSFNFCVISPTLSVTKSSNGPWTIAQSGAQYTLNVANLGEEATSGTITVRDTLPAGVTANWTGTRTVGEFNCTFSGQNVTCTRSSSIAISGTTAITLPVNVTTSAAVGTNSITNYASIGGGGDLYNGGSAPTPGTSCTNSAHCTSNSTTVLSPDLRISKSHTGNFTRGSTGTYTLTVSNNPGTASTSGTITVTDTLPTGLSVNSGAVGTVTVGGTNAANWTCNSNAATPQIITCTSTTAIAISGTSVFTFTVNVSLTAANSVTNAVAVSGGNEATANNGNNSATDPTTIIAGAPSVALVKSCTSPANCITAPQLPETDITYRIQFTNTGGQAASSLRIVDGIPGNMDYKLSSATSNVGTTGITFTIEFSSDFDALNPTLATWTYTPVTGGGGASVGYDRLVKAVSWRVTSGSLSQTSPNNTGDVSFIAKIR